MAIRIMIKSDKASYDQIEEKIIMIKYCHNDYDQNIRLDILYKVEVYPLGDKTPV